MKPTITLDGNEYVVILGEDELASFDRSGVGDQVAKMLAVAYRDGYEAGYSQCDVDRSDNEQEHPSAACLSNFDATESCK